VTVLGLDIGSRSVDAVWLADDGALIDCAIADSGHDPGAVARTFVDRTPVAALVATGYGRHLARSSFECPVITEIKAYALGVSAIVPQAASVLDIGGQDTKVIAIGPDGRVADFEMNDKCAAGTGKFLEVMATALGYRLDELGPAALASTATVSVSSMCTVFAESEVTGLVHRGEDRSAIARGVHDSIARRTLSSLKRIGAHGPLVFAGGVAKNPAMVALVREGFSGEVLVPGEPGTSGDAQTVGAHGAALEALSSILRA
jgi:(R)-2-hydroxyacyl-CoA dehydratese activating ATPase